MTHEPDVETVRPDDDDEEGMPARPGDDGAADLTNGDLARVFHEIGDMLEVKGELVFKTVAYHRAADAIGRSPVDLVAAYRAGQPPAVPGVGKAISDKIEELATTGHMAYYDRLRAEIPPGLVDLLRIPGLGPKTARQLYEQLGIDSMDGLREAAEAGRIRDAQGHVGQDGGADPRGHRAPRVDPGPDAARPGARSSSTASSRRSRPPPASSGIEPAGLVPPAARDDRRPRPPRRDR